MYVQGSSWSLICDSVAGRSGSSEVTKPLPNHLPLATCYSIRTTDNWLPTANYFLLTTDCQLLSTYHLLLTTYYLLQDARARLAAALPGDIDPTLRQAIDTSQP